MDDFRTTYRITQPIKVFDKGTQKITGEDTSKTELGLQRD